MHHSATTPPPDFSVNISEWPAAAQQQRVVIVTGSYAHAIDGVALTLNRLASHLLRSGHEVLVLSPGRRGAPVLRHAGTLVRVPSVPLPIWSEYRLTFGLGRRARAALTHFGPTVLHVAVQDALGHAALRWAEQHRVPVLCSHHTRWNACASHARGRLRSPPLPPPSLPRPRHSPLTCTRADLSYYYRGLLAPLESLMWWGMRRFHSRCAATYPPSESVAAELRGHGVPRASRWKGLGKGRPPCLRAAPHAPARRHQGLRPLLRTPERRPSGVAACRGLGSPAQAAPKVEFSSRSASRRVGVWPRGVDRTLFNPDARDETWRREVLGAGPEEAVVLFVARLRWEKGLEALASVLEAVQAKGVPHVSVVVGDGPAREELQRRLPASLFLGKASRRNLNPPRPLTRRPHPCVEPPCCRRHRVPPAPPLASRLSRAAAPLPRSAPDGS